MNWCTVVSQMRKMDASTKAHFTDFARQLQEQQKQQAELVRNSVDSLEKRIDAKLAKMSSSVKIEPSEVVALADPNVVWKLPLQAISEGISKYTPSYVRDMKPPMRSPDTSTTWSTTTSQPGIPLPSPPVATIPVSVPTDINQMPHSTSPGVPIASQSMPPYLPPQMPVPQFVPPMPYMSVPPPGFPGYPPNQGYRSGTGQAKIPPYDGSTDFYAFIKKFEIIGDSYRWDDRMKLVELVKVLTGKALDWFGRQKPEVSGNYYLLKEQFERMYGLDEDPAALRAEISTIQQKVDESLEHFGQRVRELSIKAYDGATSDLFETLSIEAFMKGCTDIESARLAMAMKPRTLNEMIQCTIKNVHTDQFLKKNKPRARRVQFDNVEKGLEEYSSRQVQEIKQPDFSDLSRSMKNIEYTLRKFCSKFNDDESPNQPSPRMSRRDFGTNRRDSQRPASPARRSPSPSHNRCFTCDKEGHFSRECPQKNSARSGSRSPSPSGKIPSSTKSGNA